MEAKNSRLRPEAAGPWVPVGEAVGLCQRVTPKKGWKTRGWTPVPCTGGRRLRKKKRQSIERKVLPEGERPGAKDGGQKRSVCREKET